MCAVCGSAVVRTGRRGPLPRFCSQVCRLRRARQRVPSLVWCRACGDPFTTSVRGRVYCSRTCKEDRRDWDRARRCVGCGWFVRTSPSRVMMSPTSKCLRCRRSDPAPRKPPERANRCAWCGSPARVKFCSARCNGLAQRGEVERLSARRAREYAAPGLTWKGRRALLATWRRQGRRCIYCEVNAVQCVDHVVPLVRGGSSREGNLAPCCKRCNCSKGGLLVVEWRARGLGPWRP